MNLKMLKTIAIIGMVISINGLQAQEANITSAGNASGSEGTVSYSVGQVFYTTNSGTNGSVSSGVQQPFEISVIIGVSEMVGINLICSAYPNPTTDFLTLKIENFDNSNLSFQLIDINGNLLENKKIIVSETSIIMSNLVPAIYFLNVIENGKVLKIFKIIKK